MSSRILAIDTATSACSVALFENEKLIASDYQEIGRGHAEKLVPMISKLPEKGRSEEIIVNCGPGSFTGIRIGISTAKALALVWDAKLTGYQCLHLVAAQTLSKLNVARQVSVVMSGGHGEFFVQNFSKDAIPIDDLESLDPPRALNKVKTNFFAGSGASDLSKMAQDEIDTAPCLPNAASALLLNQDHMALTIAPIYGREPDAVMSRFQ